MTPYRTSALATRTRETVSLPIVLGFRFIAACFALAVAACAIVMFLVDRNAASAAIRAGLAVPRVVSLAVPVGMTLVGLRAADDTRLRRIAFATAASWIIALFGEMFLVGVPQEGLSIPAMIGVDVFRVLGLTGLMIVPFLAARHPVVVRWPFIAAGAIAIADAVHAAQYAYERLFALWFAPSMSTLLLFALLAYGFHDAARVLREESVDERADRLPKAFTPMFATPDQRATFLGPMRLATELVTALTIVTLAATAGPLAYGFSLRGITPPAGIDACVLLVGIGFAAMWLRRGGVQRSLGPTAAAIGAAVAAMASAWSASGPIGSAALFIVPAAVIGMRLATPHAQEGAAQTMHRWGSMLSAAAVLLGAAGFFALTANSAMCANPAEPTLARLAKLVAVGFAIAAANAAQRLTLHARVELAAEQREP